MNNVKQLIRESVQAVLEEKMLRESVRELVAEEVYRILNEKHEKPKGKKSSSTGLDIKRRSKNVALKDSEIAYKMFPNMSKDAARSLYSRMYGGAKKSNRRNTTSSQDNKVAAILNNI